MLNGHKDPASRPKRAAMQAAWVDANNMPLEGCAAKRVRLKVFKLFRCPSAIEGEIDLPTQIEFITVDVGVRMFGDYIVWGYNEHLHLEGFFPVPNDGNHILYVMNSIMDWN